MLRSNVVCAASTSGRGCSEGLPTPPSSRNTPPRQKPLSSIAASTANVEYVPPPPVLRSPPIIHTPAYLQQTQQLLVPQIPNSSMDESLQPQLQQQADMSSNAIVWALRKVDDQLNEVEQHPSQVHKAIYDFTNGPVGQATSKGVQTAAKFTMTATFQAAKAAAPVGKWALQQGFKAAVGLVSAAMESERQQKRKPPAKGKK